MSGTFCKLMKPVVSFTARRSWVFPCKKRSSRCLVGSGYACLRDCWLLLWPVLIPQQVWEQPHCIHPFLATLRKHKAQRWASPLLVFWFPGFFCRVGDLQGRWLAGQVTLYISFIFVTSEIRAKTSTPNAAYFLLLCTHLTFFLWLLIFLWHYLVRERWGRGSAL